MESAFQCNRHVTADLELVSIHLFLVHKLKLDLAHPTGK